MVDDECSKHYNKINVLWLQNMTAMSHMLQLRLIVVIKHWFCCSEKVYFVQLILIEEAYKATCDISMI